MAQDRSYRGTVSKAARQEVTVRMAQELAAAARTRAADLRMSLNDYVVGLVQYDLARASEPGSRVRIQAEHLVALAMAEAMETTEEEAVKAS